MPDLWAYTLGMAFIIVVLFTAMGVMRIIWWGAKFLQVKAEGQQLANRLMRRELGEEDHG